MQQVLHVLKKDILRFRIEIGLVVLSAFVSVWSESREDGVIQPVFLRVLLWVTGTYLIAMVVHAEAIPGDRLLWLTRPYRWKSLLTEKLLFLFLFVSGPPAIAIFIFLQRAGFSAGSILPSLLVWEILIFLVWILPVAASAAITDKLTSFVIALLFAGAAGAVLPGFVFAGPDPSLPRPAAWIRPGILALILVLGSIPILYFQYKSRRTVVGRAFAAVTVAVGILVSGGMPLAGGMWVQSLFSTTTIDHSAMTLSLPGGITENSSGVGFPLDLNGTPAGYEAHVDALVGEVVGRDGQAWGFSSHRVASTRRVPDGPLRIDAYTERALLEQSRGKAVTVRGTIYITLFSPTRTWDEGSLEGIEDSVDGVRCGRYTITVFSRPSFFRCRGLLGSPRGRLMISNGGWYRPLGPDSYSPFPPLSLSPYDEISTGSRDLALTYTEPLSHFRLDFEIPVERFLE